MKAHIWRAVGRDPVKENRRTGDSQGPGEWIDNYLIGLVYKIINHPTGSCIDERILLERQKTQSNWKCIPN